MINFRFHLVSLVSVFLALAIGIATGASVVNQGLVKSQKSQLERLDTRLRDRGSEIAAIERERDRSLRFADEGESRFVAGRLTSTPIVVVQVDGIDEAPIRALVATLRDSGASVAAVLTLTGRSLLGTPADAEAARLALGASSNRPDTLRFLLRERLRDALLDPDKAPTLETLRAGGFVSFDGLDSSTASPALPTGARVVMASGAGAKIDSDSVLRLLQTLTADGPKRVVAVEAVDTKSNQRADAVFVPRVRDAIALRDRMSSVDDVDRLEGRVATVYALEDLRQQVTGRYGTDKTAQRLLPAAASPTAP